MVNMRRIVFVCLNDYQQSDQPESNLSSALQHLRRDALGNIIV